MATKATDAPKPARRPVREAIPNTPNPVDIAMVAAVSGKPLPDIARRVLEEEARLIRAQCTELRLREVGERVRAGLWAILAIAALLIVGLIATVVVKASRSDALIVESFRVPPAMAQQGLTGEVVAKEVLDKVAEFDQSTQSARSTTSYDNNWGDDLKIDIPQTGATADQIWKLLREWLGKETRISGEVIQTKVGMALTTRVGSRPGQRFVSTDNDLDMLVGQGALAIYKNTQPYRSAIYLLRNGRELEGRAMLESLSTDPSPRERKWAFIGLAFDARNSGRTEREGQLARRALAIDPQMLNALSGSAGAEADLGHDQAAVDLTARYLKAPITSEYDAKIASGGQCSAKTNLAWLRRDPSLAQASAECLATAAQAGSSELARALVQMLRHGRQATVAYAQPGNSSMLPAEAAATQAFVRLFAQLDAGPSPALAGALQAYRGAVAAELADPKVGPGFHMASITWSAPFQAQALAELGRTDEAAALISGTPLDCYLCVRTRGLIAQAQGNMGGAQRWFAEAARQAPRLAPAFVDWGKLLVQAKHYANAEPKLIYAAKLAPNWADPLKYWGDALAAEGKHDEALGKYDAALKLAPNWAELLQARVQVVRER